LDFDRILISDTNQITADPDLDPKYWKKQCTMTSMYILAKHPHLLNLSESALVGSSVLKERTWNREAANLRLWLIRLM
jgi:hypothetical protein